MASSTTPEQYWTIEPFLEGALPGWVPPADQVRIAAYGKYEEIYWASEEGFGELLRGDNDEPVLMPTARMLVNTVNRYTAPGFNWAVEPITGADGAVVTTDEQLAVAQLAFDQLFAREQFVSKFNGNKLKGIRRGDWLFHIIADDTKQLGRRIKIMTVHPSAYFPVYESDVVEGGDPDKLLRVHLAEQVRINNQDKVNRLTYERVFDANGNQTGITVTHGIYSLEDWFTSTKAERTIIPTKALPPTIPAIPLYHFKNGDPTERFGSSELRGSESVLLAINQTVSDEDLTLALEGLGVWATDGGPPVDAAGNTVDFVMGPGRVMTNAAGLKRLNGTASVSPYGEHYERLMGAAKEASGLSDVAIGKVDSATAESGIALLLQLGPILANTSIGDGHIAEVSTQMFHDLCFWLAEYEELPLITQSDGGASPVVLVRPTFADKIPRNIKAIIDQIISLRSLVPPVISIRTSLDWLRQVGLEIPEDEQDQLAIEAQVETDALLGTASADTTTDDRVEEELPAT